MCDEWQPIETAEEFKTVLTQHVDDLCPVPAFRCGNYWFADTEGPEDISIPGRHRLLYRTPTHWKYLPPPPITCPLIGIKCDRADEQVGDHLCSECEEGE